MAALLAVAPDAFAEPCGFYGVSPAPIWQWQNQQTGAYYLKNQFNGPWLAGFQNAGLSAIRLGIGKNQGDADYSNSWPVYDQIIHDAQANGVSILASLGGDWDFANPNDPPNDGSAPNQYIDEMVSKFITIANRYGDVIKWYEIGNEPNCCSWYIDAPVVAKMMAEIYVNAGWIIQHDGLHLVFPALYGGWENNYTGYMAQVYGLTGLWDWMQANKGRRYPWDGFGFHPYVDRSGPMPASDMLAAIDNIQGFKVQNSDFVSLWITEYGWSTQPNNIDGVWTDPATQAANIDNALGVFESRGDIAATFVFRNDEWQGYGLYDGNWNPKPAVQSYQRHTQSCTPLCPRAAQACGEGGSCCPGLTCDQGTCSACSPSGGGCNVDADCCSGLACAATGDGGKSCAPAPSTDAGAGDGGARDAGIRDAGGDGGGIAAPDASGDAGLSEASAGSGGGGGDGGCSCRVSRATAPAPRWLLALVAGFLVRRRRRVATRHPPSRRSSGARLTRRAALVALLVVASSACASGGETPPVPSTDAGPCIGCGDAGAMPEAGFDASRVDAPEEPMSCPPLPGLSDAGAGNAQPLYPDPRFLQVGPNLSLVKTACVDTTPLATHDRLDALVASLLMEAGLESAPLGDCACDWTLRFGPAPTLSGTAAATLAAGANNGELYAEVTSLVQGRPSSALYATTERGGLYALRAALATVTRGSGGGLVPASTLVDYPEIQARGFIDGVYGTLGGWPEDGCGFGVWPGPFASWPSRFTPAMRSEILRLIARLRGNTFIYGPKDDPLDRGPCNGSHKNWQDAYTTNDGLQSTIQTLALDADANLVDLYWSISPFPGFDWTNPGPSGPGFAAVKAKIDQVRALGVHHFAMFVDDPQVNGGTPDENAALMNATHAYLKSLDPTDHLLVVTWAYAFGPNASTDAYGAALDKEIEVMWTGPGIEPCSIAASDMTGPNQSYQRTLSIWDNWPAPSANSGCADDRKMTGRSSDLPTAIHGYYTNPVISEAGYPLSDELSQLGPVMDYAWGAAHYNAAVDASYSRWGAILPAWQALVHPCTNTHCVVPAGPYQGFACDPSDPSQILFCDQYENNCVTTLRCPHGCTVQPNAQDTCAN